MRVAVIVLLLLGAAARFYVAAGATELREDEKYRYDEIARNLRAGQGFAIAGHPTAQAMPLWPLLLSVLPAALKPHFFSALLSSWSLLLAWALGGRLAGPRTALVLLLLMAIDLDQVKLGGSILTEPLFTVMILAFALAWVEGRTLAAAAALGLAALTRPEAFLVPLVLALWLREWRRPLVLLAGVVLAVTPWAVRNARVFDAFVPFTTTGGITLNAGMNEFEDELPFRKRGQGRSKRFRHALVMAQERTEVTDDRELGRQAVAYALEHPGSALGITAAKAMILWTPVQRKGTSAVYAVAVLFFWWAVVRGVRLKRTLVGPLLVVMTLIGLGFLALPRYRAPYHAFVFLVAAAGVTREARSEGRRVNAS